MIGFLACIISLIVSMCVTWIRRTWRGDSLCWLLKLPIVPTTTLSLLRAINID
jgi:hypothetical protein